MQKSSGRRNLLWFVMFLAVISVLLITGCASNAPLDTLDPAGRKSSDINNLINPSSLGSCLRHYSGSRSLLRWKFKVREPKEGEESFDGGYPDEEFPSKFMGTAAEIGWTIGPTILVAAIAIFSVGAHNLDDVVAAPDEAVYCRNGSACCWSTVVVVNIILTALLGQNSQISFANEIVIPVGQDIRIHTTSQDHSSQFLDSTAEWKERFVPGRTSPWVLQSNEIGRFAGQCTEFCGFSQRTCLYAVSLSQKISSRGRIIK